MTARQEAKEFQATLKGQVVSVRALLRGCEPLFSATDIASSLGYARPQVFLRSRELQEHMRVVGVEPYFNEVGVRAAATACPKGKKNSLQR